jgi:hypothetical protein
MPSAPGRAAPVAAPGKAVKEPLSRRERIYVIELGEG